MLKTPREEKNEISIHALRMERDIEVHRFHLRYRISIHALRMERDSRSSRRCSRSWRFQSTRSAWSATRDETLAIMSVIFQSTRSAWSATWRKHGLFTLVQKFQSTRSAWSATECPCFYGGSRHNFNPRAPHGARRIKDDDVAARDHISIHALRMERDRLCLSCRFLLKIFQSTRSAWSATDTTKRLLWSKMILIHALRMERDYRR